MKMFPPFYDIPTTSSDVKITSTKNNNALVTRSRLPMKSSPYVGWFRHAPPVKSTRLTRSSSFSYARRDLRMRGNMIRYPQSSSKMKTSPYIGWFRHAPPSRIQLKKRSCYSHFLLDSISDVVPLKENNKNISSCICHDHISKKIVYVDGRLAGGAPVHHHHHHHYGDNSRNGGKDQFFFPLLNGLLVDDNNNSSSSLLSSTGGTSSPTSATLCMLNKLASWFLFPLAHDELGSAVFGSRDERSIYGGVSMGVSALMMPFLSSLIRRVPLLEDGINRDHAGQQTQREQSGQKNSTNDCDDNDDVDEYSDYDGIGTNKEEESNLNDDPSVPLEVSVSSLAQAYYAHQVSKELVEQETEYQDEMQDSQLDYVITQMDIARMVRNASRHLDVESILSLPTVIYQANKSPTKAASKDVDTNENGSIGNDGVESFPAFQNTSTAHTKPSENKNETSSLGNWSWMMVSSIPQHVSGDEAANQAVSNIKIEEEFQNNLIQKTGEVSDDESKNSTDQEKENQNQQEFCVICLEHFQEGDKLRVLPCNHLFHIGCIDKWLSGTHSHEECFTSGCPTCKKRPDYIPQGNSNTCMGDSSCPTDGSVPSWAFAKLGDALASEGASLPSLSD